MTARRAVLCVPAVEAAKVAKAYLTTADEVVVDLEDAVPASLKGIARTAAGELGARDRGSVAVRINGFGSRWFDDDLVAVAANPNVATIVVPKIEDAAQLVELDTRLGDLELASRRRVPLGLQALIESPLGLANVREIASVAGRLVALIIGYADLGASLGRDPSASWSFVQDAVLLAARIAGVQAIDGPLLSVHDDGRLADAAQVAKHAGFDGKWVIHPRQLDIVMQTFTPSAHEVAIAREIVATLTAAASEGRGAVVWKGRMLDEAVAVQARRVLSRAEGLA